MLGLEPGSAISRRLIPALQDVSDEEAIPDMSGAAREE